MPSTADVVEHTVAPPREWWERWVERRAAWWAERPTLARRWARIRAIGLWVALAWVVGLWAFWPELRSGLLAYVGALWVVVAWFFLARTKTLTWGAFLRFFAACIAWSYALGVVLTLLATVAAGQRAGGLGASVAIAGISEETLKLLPVVVVALAAPRRVARFAAIDWVLLGLATGTAFLAVEESARRVGLWVVDSLGTVIARAGLDPGQVPEEWTRFRWVPVPYRPVDEAAGFGGHAVMTAIITGLVALGLVVWQRSRTAPPRQRLLLRALALAVPVVALGAAIVDHAASNANVYTGSSVTADGTPKWLHPELATVPAWIRVPWSLLGNGHGRVWILLLVIAACLLVDAHRLSTRPAANLLARPAPGWVAGAGDRVVTALAKAPAVMTTAAATVVHGGAALVWIAGRDLAEQVAAHARTAGEPRREAMARGAATASAQRASREVTYETISGPVRTRPTRLVTATVLVLLLIAALVLAPLTATDIGTSLYRPGNPDWLAGTLDGLGRWWHGLNPGQQIAVGVGIAAIIALSGGSLGLAFGIAGVATWGLDKTHGLATFTRNPEHATRDYLLTATPAQLAADTVGVALTFAPGNFAGAAVGRGVRGAVTEFADNPETFIATRRGALADDAGVIDTAWLLSRKPVPLGDGTLFPALSAADEAAAVARYEALPRARLNGSGPSLDYQVRVYGDNERIVTTAAGKAIPDGFTPTYGAVGDAKYVSPTSRSSIYMPDAGSSLEPIAVRAIDRRLLGLADAADAAGNGVFEYVTNNPAAAQFLEGRIATLGLRGYVRLVP